MVAKKVLIFNAVLDIMKEQGVRSNIKISDIASKAQIGKGTVYEYFDNKDQIITESIAYLMEKSMDIILNINEEQELNFKDSLINLIHRIINTISINGNIHSMFISQNIGSMLSPDMKKQLMVKLNEMRLKFDEIFNTFFEKGIKEGILPQNLDKFNATVTRITLMSSSMNYIHNSFNNIVEDQDEFAHNLYEVIIKILS